MRLSPWRAANALAPRLDNRSAGHGAGSTVNAYVGRKTFTGVHMEAHVLVKAGKRVSLRKHALRIAVIAHACADMRTGAVHELLTTWTVILSVAFSCICCDLSPVQCTGVAAAQTASTLRLCKAVPAARQCMQPQACSLRLPPCPQCGAPPASCCRWAARRRAPASGRGRVCVRRGASAPRACAWPCTSAQPSSRVRARPGVAGHRVVRGTPDSQSTHSRTRRAPMCLLRWCGSALHGNRVPSRQAACLPSVLRCSRRLGPQTLAWAPGWWLLRTLLVRPERAPAAPERTCPARLQPLLRAAEAGALAKPTRTRRRLYEQMGAQLARSGLSLGAHQPPHSCHSSITCPVLVCSLERS